MDLKDIAAGPKGYIKCDIAVGTRGETISVTRGGFIVDQSINRSRPQFCVPQGRGFNVDRSTRVAFDPVTKMSSYFQFITRKGEL